MKRIMNVGSMWHRHRHVPNASGFEVPDVTLEVMRVTTSEITFRHGDSGGTSHLACGRQWHPRIFASLDGRVVEVRNYDTGATVLTYTRID